MPHFAFALAKTRASLISAPALLIGLVIFGSARTAHASSSFPEALQLALQKHFPGETFCVPLCTACHNTTQGGPQNINKFGSNLENHGFLILGNGANQDAANTKVAAALERYFSTAPGATDLQVNGKWDSDGDGISDEDELREKSSPSVAGALGEGAFCPDIAYGCGARIAPAPPPPIDRLGLFSAGLVVAGFAFLRRHRRATANR